MMASPASRTPPAMEGVSIVMKSPVYSNLVRLGMEPDMPARGIVGLWGGCTLVYEKKSGVSDSNEGAGLQKKIDITLKSITLAAKSSTSFRNLMKSDHQLSNPAFMGMVQFGSMGPGPQTLTLWERKMIRRYLHVQNPPIFIRTLVENANDENGRLIVTVTHWKITLRPPDSMNNLENFVTDHLLLAFFSLPDPVDVSALMIDDEEMPEVNQELVHQSLNANVTNLGQETHLEYEPLKMTAVDVEALSVRRDLQSRPIRVIRKEIYQHTRQFCEDFEEKHLNPAIDSFLNEFNHQLNIKGNDGDPAPAEPPQPNEEQEEPGEPRPPRRAGHCQ